MNYYLIKPEVPAGIGEESIIERIQGQPLKILNLHLVFDGWHGSDLMKTSPVFYITEKLYNKLIECSFSGIEGFEKAKVDKSDNFLELYPELELPDFYWMKINGTPKKSDFGLEALKLVVSEPVKIFLEEFSLVGASIIPL